MKEACRQSAPRCANQVRRPVEEEDGWLAKVGTRRPANPVAGKVPLGPSREQPGGVVRQHHFLAAQSQEIPIRLQGTQTPGRRNRRALILAHECRSAAGASSSTQKASGHDHCTRRSNSRPYREDQKQCDEGVTENQAEILQDVRNCRRLIAMRGEANHRLLSASYIPSQIRS